MTPPKMPAELREQVIEILAQALLADLEQHPHLYAGDPESDQPVAAATGETARDLARSPAARLPRRRRDRYPVLLEAGGKGGQSHA